MPLTCTEGSARCTRLFPHPVRYTTIPDLFWTDPSASVLPAPHAQVRAAPFDRGYAVQDVVRDETSTRGKLQAREKVEPFRSVYVPFVQRYDASSIESDHRDDSSPRPGPSSVQTEEKERFEAYPLKGIMLLSNTVSLTTTETEGVIFRTFLIS